MLDIKGQKPAMPVPPMSIFGLFWLVCMGKNRLDEIVADEKDLRISRREMLFAIENLARALVVLGVKSGDIVEIANARSRYTNIMIFFALNRIGAVACFHEEGLRHEALVGYLNRYKTKVLFTYDWSPEKIKSLRKEAQDLRHVINITAPFGEQDYDLTILENFRLGSTPILKVANYHRGVLPLNLFSAEKLAVISYTSGTTTGPKDIPLTNYNIVAMAIYSKDASGTKIYDRDYHRWMSYIHVDCPYGLCISILAPLCGGGEIIFTPDLNRRNINYYLRKNPDVIFAVPGLVEDILELANEDVSFSRLKLLATGGEYMPPKLIAEMNAMLRDRGNEIAKVVNCYGTGESQGFITTSFGDVPYNPNSVGQVPAGVSVLLLDPDDESHEVGFGQQGILCAAGKHVITHYFQRPDLDQEKFVERDGRRYLITGDMAVIDEDGYVELIGRGNSKLTVSGYKIYPNIIKVDLLGSELVRNCEVVLAPDATERYVPYAYVVLEDGVEPTEATRKRIFEYLDEGFMLGEQKLYLKDYEKPQYIEFIEELPMTKAHKIDFRKLERLAEKRVKNKAKK